MNKKAETGSPLERKLATKQKIRISGKKFHIPKSIPTSIISFILQIILLPIVLCITFYLIEYLANTVIWYLKDTDSTLIYYMIAGTLISWIFCLIHLIFKPGEVFESILNCLENMSMLTYSILYIITIIFDIVTNGFYLTFESLFRFLLTAIISIFTTLAWTTISTIIGMIVVILLAFLMRGIYKRMILYVELFKARKSRCYKALCYLIKDYNFDSTTSIDYIFITNDHINVVDEDQELQEIIFKEHNLPDLNEYSIAAIACLLKFEHPYFRIKSDLLGLTLINTTLEKVIFDDKTIEINLEDLNDIENITDTFVKKNDDKKNKKHSKKNTTKKTNEKPAKKSAKKNKTSKQK